MPTLFYKVNYVVEEVSPQNTRYHWALYYSEEGTTLEVSQGIGDDLCEAEQNVAQAMRRDIERRTD